MEDEGWKDWETKGTSTSTCNSLWQNHMYTQVDFTITSMQGYYINRGEVIRVAGKHGG